MCGILGSIPSSDDIFFKKTLHLLSHRGPDGSSVLHINGISLGHTRLSISDLSADAAQPLKYEHLFIIVNGQLYNHIELRHELQALGFSFKTQSDSEVMAAAYLKWGSDCLQKFNGMWAMAIWDNKHQELFISRDRFGVKPLFYYQHKEQFVFASEMKALMPFLDNITVADNFRYMAENIFEYEATENCLIKGIKRFPAAHYAYYRDNKLTSCCYWDTIAHIPDVPTSYEEQTETFKDLFQDACRLRLRSQVPLGVSLSGGLDSSTVSVVVQKMLKQELQAFTAKFNGNAPDEHIFAQTLCNENNIALNTVSINPLEALDDVFDGYYYFEELYLTPSFPMTATYKSQRDKGVFVSLDGHGADELFSAYGNAMFLSFMDAGLNIKNIKEITQTYNDTFAHSNAHFNKKSKAADAYLKTILWYHLPNNGLNKFYTHEQRKKILKKGYLNYALYVFFHKTVLPTLLRNYDRYAMRHGVEVRMPFLDHRVVSFCFGLPWHSKIRKGYTKAIVRDAFKKELPEPIYKRKTKIGYQAPLDLWMKNEWAEFVKDTLSTSAFINCSLVNKKRVKQLSENFYSKKNQTYTSAENLYKELSPYFWESGFLKSEKFLLRK